MYVIYSVLFTLTFIVSLPFFVYKGLRQKKYLSSLEQRLGKIHFKRQARPVIWIHSVSVGEVQAASPLVDALRQTYSGYDLVISVTTRTGYELAQRLFERCAAVFYFPLDWAWSVRKTLNQVRPSAVLIMETELWPRFIHECHQRHIPVVIVNGRLSERSFRGYYLWRRFFKRALSEISIAIMQTDEDANRLLKVGIDASKLKVSGNIKFDAELSSKPTALEYELQQRFGFGNGRPLIVAASTHAPEEEILLDAFTELTKRFPTLRLRLLVAPRHPERFDPVASLIQRSRFQWARRSLKSADHDARADVVLFDSIGELRAIYPSADLVFIGGSLVRKGGHNVLEPIAAGKCVLVGPHTFNFKSIVEELLASDAIVRVELTEEGNAARCLADSIATLLNDKTRVSAINAKAFDVLVKNRGATNRTLEYLKPLLEKQDVLQRPGASHSLRAGAMSSA